MSVGSFTRPDGPGWDNVAPLALDVWSCLEKKADSLWEGQTEKQAQQQMGRVSVRVKRCGFFVACGSSE